MLHGKVYFDAKYTICFDFVGLFLEGVCIKILTSRDLDFLP